MSQQNQPNKKDFKKIFNMNNILTQVITYAAYLVLFGSIVILTYLSFIEKFNITLDLKTLGIFSAATILLSWTCWNMFFRKQYEKIMSEDILQQELNKYSVHSRYYTASKDWTDADLQIAIDRFNEEYVEKWLRWVEKTTGKPIETKKEVYVDPKTFEETVIETKGIKELPYKKFKHKILMWRIKNHHYPESGYRTSMELLSLFSYQDANFNKRNLKADKQFYIQKSISKIIMAMMFVITGASLIPEMIDGEIWSAMLKLSIAISSVVSSVFMGAITGVRGARIKLSVVEDTCADLERWAEKKPILSPYKEPIPEKVETEETTENLVQEEVTNEIFKAPNILKK